MFGGHADENFYQSNFIDLPVGKGGSSGRGLDEDLGMVGVVV
jgi:hypothetical protein